MIYLVLKSEKILNFCENYKIYFKEIYIKNVLQNQKISNIDIANIDIKILGDIENDFLKKNGYIVVINEDSFNLKKRVNNSIVLF